MQPSAQLISYIMQHEGFSPKAYLDPPGNSRGLHSIGYGHQIQPNEQQLLNATLTKDEAQSMLSRDLVYYVNSVNNSLKRPVSQAQFDALVDFAYNDGTGAESKVAGTWNSTGDTTAVAKQLNLYIHADGKVNPDLIARRQYEAGLFQGMAHTVASVTAGLTAAVKKKN